MCDRDRIKIVYADEAVFTHSKLGKRAWSRRLENISVFEEKITVRTHAIVAGISEDKGLETYVIQPKSFKSESYIEFLQHLSEINGDHQSSCSLAT